jgi:nucleotide-binding universal stress UspA family protein
MVPQVQIQKILFTSDLTENSKHAFSYALSLASRYRAQMVFLYVMEEVPANVRAFVDQELIQKVRRQAADEARTTLTGKRRDMATIQASLKEFYDVSLKDLEHAGEWVGAGEVIVQEGNVVDTIIRTAEECACDTIVMGSRRRGVLSDVMFGSMVRGVLRRSNRLVIVAPPLPE